MKEKIELTSTDLIAISNNDKEHLNNKGAKFYSERTYYKAVEYYHLAAAMGDVHSITNLGYCYLYGRDIEQNTSLAIAYLTIAANKEDIDAMYKLGDIYGNNKWNLQDNEKSIYYYLKAINCIVDDLDIECISWNTYLENYPSLCYAIAREFFIGGQLITDLDLSYAFFEKAKIGYETAIANGHSMYEQAYQGVLQYLNKDEFDLIKKKLSQ